MRKQLPIPFCFYGELAQQLPLPVLEQIVKASKRIGESYHICFEKSTFTERGTGHALSYSAFNEMRYRRLIEMLAPAGITEEQVAAWDASIDGVTRRYLNFVPAYNLIVKLCMAVS